MQSKSHSGHASSPGFRSRRSWMEEWRLELRERSGNAAVCLKQYQTGHSVCGQSSRQIYIKPKSITCERYQVNCAILKRDNRQRTSVHGKWQLWFDMLGRCRLRRTVWWRTTKFTRLGEIQIRVCDWIWRSTIGVEVTTHVRDMHQYLSRGIRRIVECTQKTATDQKTGDVAPRTIGLAETESQYWMQGVWGQSVSIHIGD